MRGLNREGGLFLINLCESVILSIIGGVSAMSCLCYVSLNDHCRN